MEINPLDIAIHMVNIAVLYLLLRVLVYKPVSRFMQARTARIQQQLDAAAQAHEQALREKTEYEQKLAHAEEAAQQTIREGNQKAGESAAAILAAAKEEAIEVLKAAKEKADMERRESLERLEPQIASMAVSIAGEILQREIREEDNREVIDTFFRNVG